MYRAFFSISQARTYGKLIEESKITRLGTKFQIKSHVSINWSKLYLLTHNLRIKLLKG